MSLGRVTLLPHPRLLLLQHRLASAPMGQFIYKGTTDPK